MNDSILILSLLVCIILLLTLLVYLVVSQKRTLHSIKQICNKLSQILEDNTDEKILMFTDNKILIELITQVNNLLNNRQRMNAEYRKSELASKRMLSNISHDIKTPLTVILGYLEIMILNSDSNNIFILKKVENKAKQVMKLINKFFNLAKIEAGDIDFTISSININELCRENIVDFYEILTEKEFQVNVSIPENKIFVYGNVDVLNRIFVNLLSNAIRYGQDGKYIGITLRIDESFAFIDVIDQGKGIEKSLACNVFDRLYTLEDSRNRQLGGNGLGLAIAKSLANKLGGDILLESIPHVKTVFTIKLRRMKY